MQSCRQQPITVWSLKLSLEERKLNETYIVAFVYAWWKVLYATDRAIYTEVDLENEETRFFYLCVNETDEYFNTPEIRSECWCIRQAYLWEFSERNMDWLFCSPENVKNWGKLDWSFRFTHLNEKNGTTNQISFRFLLSFPSTNTFTYITRFLGSGSRKPNLALNVTLQQIKKCYDFLQNIVNNKLALV